MIRRLILLTALATSVCALVAADARAGSYTVRACQSDGINRSWATFHSDASTDAYVECPGGVVANGHTNEGMVARNTGGPGAAPALSKALVFFDAPPGARIVQVTGQSKQNGTGGWQAGLWDDGAGRWAWCGPSCLSTYDNWLGFNVALSSTRVSALTICGRGSGCDRNGRQGYVAMRDVSVVVSESTPPNVSITGGGLAASGWRRGVQQLVVDANDSVGVRHLVVSADSSKITQDTRVCDDTRVVPCPTGRDTFAIDTQLLQDGWHKLRVQGMDSAGNTRSVDRGVLVDNHAPARPLQLQVDGGAGWRSSAAVTVRWAEPKQPAAPVAGSFVTFCRLELPSTCTASRQLGHVHAATLQAPGVGQWRARVWLQDAAGNATPNNASEAIVRVDDQPPALSFLRPAADHPALVRVAAADKDSGLATREILLRRRESNNWFSLPVAVTPAGFSAIIDDETLSPGIYELRARAVDLAGNEQSTERLADGKTAELRLPLRMSTTLQVGRPTRVRARGSGGKRHYRIKLVAAPRSRYGTTIPLRGRLTSPGGNPLAGKDVQILEQTNLAAAPWRPLATVRTSRTGRFTFKALSGPSRTLRFRFSGSDSIRGRTADVRLGVRAASSLGVSRRRIVNGESVLFRGRLEGRPLPRGGKLVELQAFARGRWLTFGTTRTNARTGRWAYAYRFSATRGNVRYRFRARLPKEASYPYEGGASRSVAVQVRGL